MKDAMTDPTADDQLPPADPAAALPPPVDPDGLLPAPINAFPPASKAPTDPSLPKRISRSKRQIFLQHLAFTGSVHHACAAANRDSRGPPLLPADWIRLEQEDAAFLGACESARSTAQAHLEAEVTRRALLGTERVIYQRGRACGVERVYDNALLLRLLAKQDPTWRETKRSEVDAHVTHHSDGPRVIISAEEIQSLNPDLRAHLYTCLTEIQKFRKQKLNGNPN